MGRRSSRVMPRSSAALIATAPCRIARELGRSKYGALYLIDQLTSLGESIASNGGLDDEQRACLFDHSGCGRGVPQRQPEGPGGPRWSGVGHSCGKRGGPADHQDRARARTPGTFRSKPRRGSGSSNATIQETRNLRSDQLRADRRVKWAWQALDQVRAGVDPATIIDPYTRKPIAPGPGASPVAEPAAPPTPTPTATPASPSSETPRTKFRLPPIPDEWPEHVKQNCRVLSEAFKRHWEASNAEDTRPARRALGRARAPLGVSAIAQTLAAVPPAQAPVRTPRRIVPILPIL